MQNWTVILRMQTLGLSDSGERTDGRLKSLFWPAVESGADVDYLGAQGYWVCSFVAATTFIFASLQGRPILGFAFLLFYYLGGVGVRERDLFAAVLVFALYFADTVLFLVYLLFGSPWGIVLRAVVTALLFSNVRATWIASSWQSDSEETALPPRLGDTWSDKFADRWPAIVWPKVRIIYYVFALCVLLVVLVGLASAIFRSIR